MRKKDEIMKDYIDEGADAKSDAHLSMLTVVNLLEVLIDIRDILGDFHSSIMSFMLSPETIKKLMPDDD